MRLKKYLTLMLLGALIGLTYYMFSMYSPRQCIKNTYMELNGISVYVYDVCFAPLDENAKAKK